MSTTWQIEDEKRFPKLEVDVEVDIAVIGGGLAGVWCAYLLAKNGRKVAVIEKDKLGHGETFYTTAFITCSIDTPLVELVKIFGKEKARLIWKSGMDAIDLIEKTVSEENIDCNFKREPVTYYAEDKKEYEELKKEHEISKELGFETTPIGKEEIPIESVGGLKVEHQAKYHPIKFFSGLVRAAESLGAKFYEYSEVESYENGEVCTKDGCVVEAKDIIITTYDPLGNPTQTRLKKGMYTTYVYELSIPLNSIDEGMYIDQKNPYHYIRVDKMPDKMSVLVGGEDHRSELKIDEAKNFDALKKYWERAFPDTSYEIVEHWKGAILEPSDGIALIGQLEPHLYIASAFSGNGMTYSAISGMLISSGILGKGNPYIKVYDPRRKRASKAFWSKFKDYFGEFVGGALKNYFK